MAAAAAPRQIPFNDLLTMKLWDVSEHTQNEEGAIDFAQRYGLIRSTPTCGRDHIPMPIIPNYKDR